MAEIFSNSDSTANSPAARLVKRLLRNKMADQQLFTLADITPVRTWNYELPTLTARGRFTSRQPWTSSEEFRDALIQKFAFFEHVDLSNIAMMGGACFDLLHDRASCLADIDLFLVGDLPGEGTVEQKVLRRAERFMEDIFAFLEEHVRQTNEAWETAEKSGLPHRKARTSLANVLSSLKATRNGPVITFNIPTVSVPVQLVLSSPRSVQDLLRRVDLDCTAIAFVNGKDVYFNTISKFCYENACAIIGNNCNQCFESRIAKYFSVKGVDIIMPLLDLKKIPQRNLKYKVEEVLDLARMAVIYTEIVQPGGKILTSRIVPNTALGVASNDGNARRLCTPGGGAGGARSSYTAAARVAGGAKAIKNGGQIIHENIIHLLHGYSDKLQFYGEGKLVKDVLVPIPKFTSRMITNSYDTVKEKLMAFKDGTFDVLLLEKYFTVRPTSQIISDILLTPLRDAEGQADDSRTTAGTAMGERKQQKTTAPAIDNGPYSALDNQYGESVLRPYFDALIKDQIQQVEAKLSAVVADQAAHPEKYAIVVEMPFEDLDLVEWYGERYVVKGEDDDGEEEE